VGAADRVVEKLRELRGYRTTIVGIGNTLKGDDGAGPLVCQQLCGKVCAGVMDVGTVPENYIQPIVESAPENLLIIDAIDFGASAGTIGIFKPEHLNSAIISTHTLSPRVFVNVICKETEADPYFVGIQPAQTQLGQSISPEVRQAVQWLVDVLTETFPLTE
jgi:hydrogenase 3 maturation protease